VIGIRRFVWLGADGLLFVGMAGMEQLVRQSVVGAGLKAVKVVDGARAGVEILAGLVRLSRADAA